MVKIAAIGEVMVELSPCPTTSVQASPTSDTSELMSLSFAGDTYNTAIYLARFGLETHYVTLLGDDPYSSRIMQRMREENIHTGMIQQLKNHSPGLYIIRNTHNGEREFFYWRKEAPARQLCATQEEANNLFTQLRHFDCVYLSGITLAIITPQARLYLLDVLKKLRIEGVVIALDSNYRPRLWNSVQEAQQNLLSFMQYTDIALLTMDDEFLLWGDDTTNGSQQRYQPFNIRELLLKRGAEDVIIFADNKKTQVPVPVVNNVIDTTGAGDSFNAGYLAARMQGKSIAEAVTQGTGCAAIVIQYRGAIIDKSIYEQKMIHA